MARITKGILTNFLNNHFEVRKTSDPNEVRINSFYTNDKKYHLYINLEKGVFMDYKSSIYGPVEKMISDFLEVPQYQIGEILVKEYAGNLTDRTVIEEIVEEVEREKELQLPDGLKFFANTKEGLIRDRAYRYLHSRNISDKIINTLGYIYKNDSDFNERIFIPFIENGRIVYFLARDFMGNGLRYKNPVGIDSKKFVYNYDNIKDEVVICEGIFDALSLDNQIAIPILSAHLSPKQINKILDKEPKSVIIVPDNDPTGEKTLQRNIDLFRKYSPPSLKLQLKVFRLPADCKDLNEMKCNTGKNFIDIEECEDTNRKIVFGFQPKKINIFE